MRRSNGSRRSLQMRSDLERLAADWHRNDRDESYLIRGERLVILGGWSDENPTDLSPLERDFVAASRRLATSELDASRRSNRRLRVLLVGLGVLLVAAGVLAVVAREQTREAQDQAQRALSQRLAVQARSWAETQPDLSLLLGLESLLRASSDGNEEAQSALLTALGQPLHIATQLTQHSGQVRDVAYSPDGTVLATASLDHTIRLWDAATERPRGQPLEGHADGVLAVAFSRDGTVLASASEDKTVRLWDTTTGSRNRQAAGRASRCGHRCGLQPGRHDAGVGQRRPRRAFVGRANGRTARRAAQGSHEDAVSAVAFSPRRRDARLGK